MNLYLLQRSDDAKPEYDAAFGFVVRAEIAQHAREYAAANCGDEGCAVWLDIMCEEIASDVPGKSGVVLRDFNAG